MIETIVALLVALGAAILAALGFRAKQQRADSEAKRYAEQAESAQAAASLHRRVEDAREETQAHHRQEKADAEAEVDAGRRDHLENRW